MSATPEVEIKVAIWSVVRPKSFKMNGVRTMKFISAKTANAIPSRMLIKTGSFSKSRSKKLAMVEKSFFLGGSSLVSLRLK